MDWLGLSCNYVKFLAIAAMFVGMFSNPFGLHNRTAWFPRRWGFPALAAGFGLLLLLMASDRC